MPEHTMALIQLLLILLAGLRPVCGITQNLGRMSATLGGWRWLLFVSLAEYLSIQIKQHYGKRNRFLMLITQRPKYGGFTLVLTKTGKS